MEINTSITDLHIYSAIQKPENLVSLTFTVPTNRRITPDQAFLVPYSILTATICQTTTLARTRSLSLVTLTPKSPHLGAISSLKMRMCRSQICWTDSNASHSTPSMPKSGTVSPVDRLPTRNFSFHWPPADVAPRFMKKKKIVEHSMNCVVKILKSPCKSTSYQHGGFYLR